MSDQSPRTTTMSCPDCEELAVFTCDERADTTKTSATPDSDGWHCGECGQYLRGPVMKRIQSLETLAMEKYRRLTRGETK